MKNKKSIYDYIKMSCYKYAPEQFHATYKGKLIQFSAQQNQEIGYIYLTKGYNAAIAEIKRIFRKHSIFANNKNIFKTLAIRTNEGKNTYIKISSTWGYGRVDIFDIRQKLDVFKAIKEAYNRNNFNIQVTTGIMQEYGKMSQGTMQEIQKPALLNRIIYV